MAYDIANTATEVIIMQNVKYDRIGIIIVIHRGYELTLRWHLDFRMMYKTKTERCRGLTRGGAWSNVPVRKFAGVKSINQLWDSGAYILFALT